jgi:hypothetical protein
MNAWDKTHAPAGRQGQDRRRKRDRPPELELGVMLLRTSNEAAALAKWLDLAWLCGWMQSRLSWQPELDSLSAARVTVVLSASPSCETERLLKSTQATLANWSDCCTTSRITAARFYSRDHGERDLLPYVA